jgi:hypothetical protein
MQYDLSNYFNKDRQRCKTSPFILLEIFEGNARLFIKKTHNINVYKKNKDLFIMCYILY